LLLGGPEAVLKNHQVCEAFPEFSRTSSIFRSELAKRSSTDRARWAAFREQRDISNVPFAPIGLNYFWPYCDVAVFGANEPRY
jgi:hypothetical protein